MPKVCWELQCGLCSWFTAKSDGERILKPGQAFGEVTGKSTVAGFSAPPCSRKFADLRVVVSDLYDKHYCICGQQWWTQEDGCSSLFRGNLKMCRFGGNVDYADKKSWAQLSTKAVSQPSSPSEAVTLEPAGSAPNRLLPFSESTDV